MNIRPFLKLWFQRWLQSLPKSVKLRFWAQIKPLLPKEKTEHLNDPFHPNFTLLWLSDSDPYRLTHAYEGTLITGGSGSGKTSGPGNGLMKAFMRAGMGGLVLTTKPDDYELVRTCAEQTGRLRSLIRFAPDEKWRCNFLRYEQTRPSRGSGLTANIVKLFTSIQESLERGEGSGGKSDVYFKNALSQMLNNGVDLCILSGEPLSVSTLNEIIMSAPTSPEQVDSENWQNGSFCYGLLEKSLRNDTLTHSQVRDRALTGKYFLSELPSLPHDTRGSIISTFSVMADGFLRGAIGELFSTGLNLVPEMTFDGAIIVCDLPVKAFGHTGRAAQAVMKRLTQECWERRDVNKYPRPCFLWQDEAHNHVCEYDALFQLTARSSRACTVCLSQSLSNFEFALGGDGKAKALVASLMGVLQTKIFCASTDPKNNQWAAEVFGKSWTQKVNSGVSHADKGGRSSSSGSAESLEYSVQPADFVTLRKGGISNNYLVDCIIHGGRTFRATGTTALRTTFSQKG